MKRILAVVSSAPRYANGRPTGLWIGELTHFAQVLDARGVGLDVASIAGGTVPIDPVSEGWQGQPHAPTRAFYADDARRRSLEQSTPLADIDLDRYEGVYFAGGHGAMFDFRGQASVARAIQALWARGKIVSAVCHGVAALLDVQIDGAPLVRCRSVTGFSNVEERLALRWSEVPFHLESDLRAQGAAYQRASLPFVSHVVEDGLLLTGQNPGSAKALGEAVARRCAR